MAWRDHVKYPEAEGFGSLAGVDTMDILDELLPIESCTVGAFDRLGIFLNWLREADKAGLVPVGSNDEMQIRAELIHGCGGL
jgi:hypothetical protein